MYKVEIPSDTLRDAAIQRRRQLDEERKKRIFDPKLRIYGIDVKALEEQIRMKQEVRDVERQREEAFDHTTRHTNQILERMDEAAAQAAKQRAHELDLFRRQNQPTHLRRDYDLYNPLALKNERPPRCSSADNRCGISACQTFEGEDLASWERRRLQKEQMRVWAEQGAWEKRKERWREEEERRKYEEYQAEISAKTLELQKAVEQASQEQAKRDRETNLQLAEQRRLKEAADRHREEELSLREIESQYNGTFLTERPDVFCIGGGHQVRVEEFKGITPEQHYYILQMQEKQRREAEHRRTQTRAQETAFAIQEAANLRAETLLQREKLRKDREEAVRMRDANRSKAGEDKLRKHYMDKVLYTNPPTADFFAQFNTSSR
ncbi:Protein Tax-1, partial [Rhizophlyctis rosea]